MSHRTNSDIITIIINSIACPFTVLPNVVYFLPTSRNLVSRSNLVYLNQHVSVPNQHSVQVVFLLFVSGCVNCRCFTECFKNECIYFYLCRPRFVNKINCPRSWQRKIAHIVDKTNYLIAKYGYEKSKQINYFLKFYKWLNKRINFFMAKYRTGIAAHYVEFGLIKITFDNTCLRKNQVELNICTPKWR